MRDDARVDGRSMATRPTGIPTRHHDRAWPVRASLLGLLLVLCYLTGFAIHNQVEGARGAQRVALANDLSLTYQDARFWIGQEESLERKYRLEPGPEVRGLHEEAERNLLADLARLQRLDGPSTAREAIGPLLALHRRYVAASEILFRAVDAGDDRRVVRADHDVVDPVFSRMATELFAQARRASTDSARETTGARARELAARRNTIVAFALGLSLLAIFWLVISRSRREAERGRARELERVATISVTDSLTSLRNHRAFQEDLARSLERSARTGAPTSLVMVDLDGLKKVNDTLGHQAGDERLRALAAALGAVAQGTDRAYRIGGDEFAAILEGVDAWHALGFVHRLHDALAAAPREVAISATAGIAEAPTASTKDALINQADLALISAKRTGQHALVYTRDLQPMAAPPDSEAEEQHIRTLSAALAVAVDAKDSYTRSHCQTVAQLCVLISAELGFDEQAMKAMRTGGLLHDVGKIGVPDAILQKPAALTPEEYEQVKAHSELGYNILCSAGLPTQAEWVRHHHERYDGAGYPDGLRGEDIPLEARVICVADAFEAMTSDRPYRKAPGSEYAIGEVRRHAGTQFDAAVVDALCRVLGSSPQSAGQSHGDTAVVAPPEWTTAEAAS